MATRSLLDVFLLMRNSAQQQWQYRSHSRTPISASATAATGSYNSRLGSPSDGHYCDYEEEYEMDDRAALMPHSATTAAAAADGHRLERASGGAVRRRSRRAAGGGAAPPAWLPLVDWLLSRCERTEQLVARLHDTRQQQLARPSTFDDSTADQEERRAAQLHEEIGHQLRECQQQLQLLRSKTVQEDAEAGGGGGAVRRLGERVVMALAQRLQRVSGQYASVQADYLRERRRREHTAQTYFDDMLYTGSSSATAADTTSAPSASSALSHSVSSTTALSSLTSTDKRSSTITATAAAPEWSADDLQFLLSGSSSCSGSGAAPYHHRQQQQQQQVLYSQQQLLQLELETRALQERDGQVQQLNTSLAELHAIFLELGRLVHDQGSVVDRIDVAVENTQQRVHQALQQLQRADRYQNSSRRLQLLLVLVAVAVLLIILLVWSK